VQGRAHDYASAATSNLASVAYRHACRLSLTIPAADCVIYDRIKQQEIKQKSCVEEREVENISS
jgi:hypothetical protein